MGSKLWKTGGFRKPGCFSLTKNGWSPKPCGDDCGKRNNPSYINIPFASTLVTPKQTISDGSKWWNLPIFSCTYISWKMELKHPHQEQKNGCLLHVPLLAPVPSISKPLKPKRLHFLLAIVAIMARNIHIITLVLGRRCWGKIGRNPRPSGEPSKKKVVHLIHPRKLTNGYPKMMVWKRWFLLNMVIFGFYVKFLEGIALVFFAGMIDSYLCRHINTF